MSHVANSSEEKQCKKCKKKVTNAFTLCKECNEIYHKSCLQLLVTQGRKCDIITENEMICYKHGDTPKMDETENVGFEIEKIKQENVMLKQEIAFLKAELEKLKSANYRNLDGTLDDIADADNVKTVIDDVKNMIKENLAKLKKEVNDSINNKFALMMKSHNVTSEHVSHKMIENSKTVPKSYRDVVKNQDVVIIKPKNPQDSATTFEVLQQNINPEDEEIGIQRVKEIKDGGILISCKNREDVNKLHIVSKEKLNVENYIIRKSELKKPKIKIIGLNNEISEENLKCCILKQNSISDINTWKMLVCKKLKKKYMSIVEVDPASFEEIMKLEKLNVKWDVCRAFEHFNVRRCYGCGGFNHTHPNCKEKVVCLNCGKKDHNEDQCANEASCVNCLRANEKLKLNLNTKHFRYDNCCQVLQKHIDSLKGTTQYTI